MERPLELGPQAGEQLGEPHRRQLAPVSEQEPVDGEGLEPDEGGIHELREQDRHRQSEAGADPDHEVGGVQGAALPVVEDDIVRGVPRDSHHTPAGGSRELVAVAELDIRPDPAREGDRLPAPSRATCDQLGEPAIDEVLERATDPAVPSVDLARCGDRHAEAPAQTRRPSGMVWVRVGRDREVEVTGRAVQGRGDESLDTLRIATAAAVEQHQTVVRLEQEELRDVA